MKKYQISIRTTSGTISDIDTVVTTWDHYSADDYFAACLLNGDEDYCKMLAKSEIIVTEVEL